MKLVIANILIFTALCANAQSWSLEQCVDSAYKNNIKIEVAKNNQEISQLKHKEVRSYLLPKLSLNGEYKYFVELPYQLLPLSVFGGPEGQFKETQFGVQHNINANLVLQAPVYSSTLNGNIQKVKLAKEIVEIEVAKSYDQVYFEVSKIYRNAQLISSQVNYIDSSIVNMKRVQLNIERLVSEKLANQSDVSKVELKISTLELNKSRLKTKLKQLYNALELLTATDLEITVESEILMMDIQPYVSNGDKELEVIQLQERMLTIDLKTLKRSRFLPELGFVATYGTQGYGFDQDPNRFLNFYPVGYAGIKLSQPLFNGMVTNKQIHQKELEIENLKLKEELIEDSKNLEIQNAILELENAFSNVELNDQQVELAQLIYTQEESKLHEGLISINDLLFAQNELLQNQQNYLMSVAQFLAADLHLKYITNNISNK
jgi:outer membrane protein TolC